jgi:hypothetical protein
MPFDSCDVQAEFLAVVKHETLVDSATLDCKCAAEEELGRGVQSLLIAHHKPEDIFDRHFIAPGEQVAAIHVQRADTSDEGRPSPSQAEHAP